jgi:hypothetical protein
MRVSRLFFSTIFVLLIAGCSSRDLSRFGRGMNGVRQRNSIPVIPSDWIEDARNARWMHPGEFATVDVTVVGHIVKQFGIVDNQLVDETDIYSLAGTYPSRDPDRPGRVLHEGIDIKYYYKAPKSGAQWECSYNTGDGSRDISLQEAEAILAKSGLSRLNYGSPAKQ